MKESCLPQCHWLFVLLSPWFSSTSAKGSFSRTAANRLEVAVVCLTDHVDEEKEEEDEEEEEKEEVDEEDDERTSK